MPTQTPAAAAAHATQKASSGPAGGAPGGASGGGAIPARVHKPLAPLYTSVLDMVGNTPMLELTRLDVGPCRLLVKMENLNPAMSIKDRIGLWMVEAAEREGKIDPKANPRPTIVEGTAGNTGLALALMCVQRGYRLLVVVPDKMSQEKIMNLRAMGAEVVMARSDVHKGHPEYYQDVAERLAKEIPNAFYINQFANDHNWRAHYETTGPEVWDQCEGKVDAVVVGVGSGGTLTGVAKYLKEKNPNIKVVVGDPVGSIIAPLVNEGREVAAGSWMIEGMGEDFVPPVCHLDLADEAIAVTDRDAFLAGRELLRREGILAGSSAGALLHAAMVWARRQTEPKTVVTFICDSGAKYLSKMFNDFWMMDQGFLEREKTGDLRDLIARRHAFREDYTVSPMDPVRQAHKNMMLYGVSQMAVVEPSRTHKDRDTVVGVIDDSDILLALDRAGGDAKLLERPVREFMTSRLETVPPTADVKDLMPIFRADRVAIVSDAEGVYYGLITKIDLINYLRAQLA